MFRWKSPLLVVLCVSPTMANAQWNTFDRDSLERAIRIMPDDTTKLIQYDALSWAYLLSTQGDHITEAADSLALRLMNAADPYHMPWSDAMDGLGVVSRAIHLPERALHQFTAERDTLLLHAPHAIPNIVRARIHRAAALRDLSRFQEGHAELDACDSSNSAYAALVLVERAFMFAAQGDTSRAVAAFRRAEHVVANDAVQWNRIPALEPAARFYFDAGLTTEAERVVRQCIEVADKVGDKAAWCGCKVITGEVLMRRGDAIRAEHELTAAMDTARKYNYIGISRESGDDGGMVRAAEILKDVYKAQGRTADALAMTERWTAWKDTLRIIEGRDELLRFDLRQQELTDSIADAKRLEEATRGYRETIQEERSRRNVELAVGLSALVIAILVAWFLFNRRRQERKLADLELRRAQQEHMIAALRMHERMSEDLHEDLGAGLSALKLWSEMDLADETDPRRRQQLAKRSAMADELVASLRQIIWALNSPSTGVKQLVDYLVDYAHLYCAQHGLRLRAVVGGPWPNIQLSAEQRRYPFLAVKEILMNTVKHAEADHVGDARDLEQRLGDRAARQRQGLFRHHRCAPWQRLAQRATPDRFARRHSDHGWLQRHADHGACALRSFGVTKVPADLSPQLLTFVL
ncbi:MAG: heme exporter protein CcmD [Flavobacteriales bacterium]|nr:heme exporter protein CcmD [Flavobacteriales bacterium]